MAAHGSPTPATVADAVLRLRAATAGQPPLTAPDKQSARHRSREQKAYMAVASTMAATRNDRRRLEDLAADPRLEVASHARWARRMLARHAQAGTLPVTAPAGFRPGSSAG